MAPDGAHQCTCAFISVLAAPSAAAASADAVGAVMLDARQRAGRLQLLALPVALLLLLPAPTQQQQNHQRSSDGWCGSPPAWREAEFSSHEEAVSQEEALTLLLAVHSDISAGVRRGCVDRGSVNFDPAATLDDGSCRETFRPGDACLVALAQAWDACTELGDACSDSCSAASHAANESLVAESCAEAVHVSGRSFAELLVDLSVAVGAVDCTPPAVVVSVAAAATVGGTVALASFQAAVAAAMGGDVEASDVVVEAFEQTATAAVVLPGSPSDFSADTAAGQSAREQFTSAIAALYTADVRTSAACPAQFPHASATYNNVICYNEPSFAHAGSGPCNRYDIRTPAARQRGRSWSGSRACLRESSDRNGSGHAAHCDRARNSDAFVG